MKRIFILVLLSALLVSGCTQSGMLTSGEGCKTLNETHTEIAQLEARVLSAEREILWSGDLGYYMEGTVRLINSDQEGGWFILTFSWMRPGQGMPRTEKKSLHLNPGEEGVFKSICPDIDPQMGAYLTYRYKSYPDSGRTVERQLETSVCG